MVAGIVTPLMAVTVGWLADTEAVERGNGGAFIQVMPPLVVVLALCAAVWRRGRVARIVRFALAATAAQVVLAFTAWALWLQDGNVWSDLFAVPLVDAPIYAVVAIVVIAMTALGHQSFTRRRATPSWLRPLVVFSITNLLLFGLWLPLIASFWSTRDFMVGHALIASPTALFVVLGPPAIAALLVSLVRTETLARAGTALGVGLATAVLAGVATRGEVDAMAEQIYGEMVPVLGSFALLSLGGLVVLAVCQCRALLYRRRDSRRTSPWIQSGIAVGRDGQPAGTWLGTVHSRGTLGGFASNLEAFRIRTRAGGLVEVPRGSVLSLPLPSSSVSANAGEVVSVLRVGDPVVASGYIAAPDDGYRRHAAPIPSDEGIFVRAGEPQRTSEALAYVLWRPCVLYLLAVSAIAIPGLIGFPF